MRTCKRLSRSETPCPKILQ
uniref:Uncharacterized protein n=1 Tax=Rhizophora mucronata TaxID=61149 RepID=A0A2P2NQA6_RHIMU